MQPCSLSLVPKDKKNELGDSGLNNINYLTFLTSSGLKDAYTDIVAGPSKINNNGDSGDDDDDDDDDTFVFKRRCKPVVAIPDR